MLEKLSFGNDTKLMEDVKAQGMEKLRQEGQGKEQQDGPGDAGAHGTLLRKGDKKFQKSSSDIRRQERLRQMCTWQWGEQETSLCDGLLHSLGALEEQLKIKMLLPLLLLSGSYWQADNQRNEHAAHQAVEGFASPLLLPSSNRGTRAPLCQ